MSTNRVLPTIVIVGPTASGKTGLSLEIARRYKSEILCADSRTVYRELDIGTAKPTLDEQVVAPHWGLDLIDPNEAYSAARYQHYARRVLEDIKSRGHVPIVVGGTGMYIDALLYDYSFAAVDAKLRAQLEAMTRGQLINYCEENNINLPNDHENTRRLRSTILRKDLDISRKHRLEDDVYIVGITTYKRLLRQRIMERAKAIFEAGVVEEATAVATRYGWDAPGLSGNIYPVIRSLEEGNISRSEAIDIFATLDWRLAKRQMTWFRRNPDVYWAQLDGAAQVIARSIAMYPDVVQLEQNE